MDEIEDLKRLGFLINEGFLIQESGKQRIPTQMRIPIQNEDSYSL